MATVEKSLVQAGDTQERPAVRRLLTDSDVEVRLRIALALAGRADKEAVPVLIDALAEESLPAVDEARELLLRLAGERSPKFEAGQDAASRRRLRAAWAGWWKEAAATIDMGVLNRGPRLLGYTLLVGGQSGQVMEIDRQGKQRWSIGNLVFPADAYVLSENRLLVAECNGNRVTERDFKGNILWQKNINGPVNAQRLPNGNTFIATAGNELLEVDRSGKTTWSMVYTPGLMAGYKCRDGTMVCITDAGQCVRLSAEGKELKSFPGTHGQPGCTSGIDVANGRILIAQAQRGLAVEMDGDGKVLWQASAQASLPPPVCPTAIRSLPVRVPASCKSWTGRARSCGNTRARWCFERDAAEQKG